MFFFARAFHPPQMAKKVRNASHSFCLLLVACCFFPFFPFSLPSRDPGVFCRSIARPLGNHHPIVVCARHSECYRRIRALRPLNSMALWIIRIIESFGTNLATIDRLISSQRTKGRAVAVRLEVELVFARRKGNCDARCILRW